MLFYKDILLLFLMNYRVFKILGLRGILKLRDLYYLSGKEI